VADEQQTPVGGYTGQCLERLADVEVTGQRRVGQQPLALDNFRSLPVPLLGCQLRGLARTRLGAEQHQVKGRSEPHQGDARRACLGFAAGGQLALGV